MASDANVTVIGRSAIFRGDITGDGDVQIEGTLQGNVELANGRITVGPQARVKARLRAQEIVVQGFVEGELRTTGRAELRSTATVVGNVFAARFSVEDEATLRGKVELAPAVQKPEPTESNGSAATQRSPAGASAVSASEKTADTATAATGAKTAKPAQVSSDQVP